MPDSRRRAFSISAAPVLCAAVSGLVLILSPILAQTAGSISGTIRDPSGAVLPGVAIRAEGPALQGAVRTTFSGDDGTYHLAPLPPGSYELQAFLDGFDREIHRGLRVGVGEDLLLDLALRLATVEEMVVVEGSAASVAVRESGLVSRISPEAIDNLPTNGRNFEDLVALVPGVKPEPGALRDRSFSILGERPAATSFIVDGADNNDPVDGGSLIRFTQDAIQEFEVLTTGYEAEFGRAQGGVVNVVTRSGTERLQGNAFLFGRDDSLDASNVPDQDAPKLERQQGGLTLGGPLLSDRAFFFLSAEVLDEERGRNVDFSVVPDWVADGLATPGGGEDFGAGPTTDGLTGLVKVDLLPGDTHRLSLSLQRTDDDSAGEVPPGIAGALVLPSATRAREAASTGVTLRDTWLWNDETFVDSSLRVTTSRTLDNLDRDARAEAVLLLFPGSFIQTASPLGAERRDLERLHLAQSLTRLLGDGDHEIKLGYEFLSTELSGFDQVTNDVEYSAAFFSPDAVEIQRRRFEELGFAQSAARFFFLPGTPGGSFDLDLSNDDVGLFIQDEWRTGRLTIDLGLRYDRASLFGDDDDNFGPRFGLTWDVGGGHRTLLRVNAGVFHDRSALLAASTVPEKGGVFTRNAFDIALPRLGFDYTDSLIDVVITSGLPGVFPAENPAYADFAEALRDDPFFLYELLGISVDDPSAPPVVTADNLATLSGLAPAEALALLEATFPGTDWEFFDVPGGSIVGDRVLSFFPRGPLGQTRDISVFEKDETPRTEALTIGVEHRLTPAWTVAASYVRRRTRDLLTRRITNLFDVPPGDPNFAQTADGGPRRSTVTYDGFIDTDAVILSARRPFQGGWGLQASYTYSDAVDNLLTGEVGSGFSNNNRPELDVGPSNLSVPHLSVVSGMGLLPRGVRVAGNLFWRSGNALSPRGLSDTDGDGLVDQRDLSVPRNSLRVDDHFQLDLRAEKAFTLTPGHELRLLVELINATNEANVAGVNAVSGPTFGVPNSFFPGREVQLGVRYFFGR